MTFPPGPASFHANVQTCNLKAINTWVHSKFSVLTQFPHHPVDWMSQRHISRCVNQTEMSFYSSETVKLQLQESS